MTLAAGGSPDSPALVSATARPDRSGAFTARLSFAGLPVDSYQLQVIVKGRVVSSTTKSVTIDIEKGFPIPDKLIDTVNRNKHEMIKDICDGTIAPPKKRAAGVTSERP